MALERVARAGRVRIDLGAHAQLRVLVIGDAEIEHAVAVPARRERLGLDATGTVVLVMTEGAAANPVPALTPDGTS